MPTRITPPVEPLPVHTSTYRGNHGRLRRLTVTAIPRQQPDLDKLAEALLGVARQRIEERRRQATVLRGEVKPLPAANTLSLRQRGGRLEP